MIFPLFSMWTYLLKFCHSSHLHIYAQPCWYKVLACNNAESISQRKRITCHLNNIIPRIIQVIETRLRVYRNCATKNWDILFCRYFVIAMALVGGYLVLSLPISIVTIVRPHAVGPRLLLLILDTVSSLIISFLSSDTTQFVTWQIKMKMFSYIAGNINFCYSCRRRRRCHCLLSSQRQSKHKLVRNLPAIWWFLPESQWGCGGILHSCSPLRDVGGALWFCSPKALRDTKFYGSTPVFLLYLRNCC